MLRYNRDTDPMNKPAFHHPRRKCEWCEGGFRPIDTLSPATSEQFCSATCALEWYQARVLDVLYPGAFNKAEQVAVAARSHWRMEIARRLRDGREQASQREQV